MASGWWDRFARLVGFGADEDEDIEVAAVTEMRARRRPQPNVVNLADRQGGGVPGPMKVLVVAPRHFDDVQGIADQLRNRRPVILNLESVEKELAQRILNFLHGAIYALGGETQKVAAAIFFFAPPGVDVSNLSRGLGGTGLGGAAYNTDELLAQLTNRGSAPS